MPVAYLEQCLAHNEYSVNTSYRGRHFKRSCRQGGIPRRLLSPRSPRQVPTHQVASCVQGGRTAALFGVTGARLQIE